MPPKRPLFGKSAPKFEPDEGLKDRKRGALLGLAVGNALGLPLEGKPLPAPAFPKLAKGPYRGFHNELLAAGPQRIVGVVNHEAQLPICLAQTLSAQRAMVLTAALEAYRTYNLAGGKVPPSLAEVLADPQSKGFPLTISRRVWLRQLRQSADNGALARVAPIAVFFSGNAESRIKAIIEECALSHYDPRCILASVALSAAIAASLHRNSSSTGAEVMAKVSGELARCGPVLAKTAPELMKEITSAMAELRADLAAAQEDDPQLYAPEFHLLRTPNRIRVAMRLVFWEFLHTSSFEEGLVDAINRGGDTDTHGALAGALLGAFYGEKEIPTRWVKPVLDAPVFGKTQWKEGYDVRHLLRLADLD